MSGGCRVPAGPGLAQSVAMIPFTRSRLNISFPQGALNLVLDVSLPQEARRARLLAIGQRILPIIKELSPSILVQISHEGGHSKFSWESVSLREALAIDEPARKLGFRIRMARLDSGLRQLDLAKRAGINRSHLSDLERGLSEPSKETLDRIWEALGLPPDKRPTRG
jgi:DNA-binding XRE family transcriptional regulator